MAEVAEYLGTFCAPGMTWRWMTWCRRTTPTTTGPRSRHCGGPPDQGYRGEFLRKHGAGDGRFYSGSASPPLAFGVGGAGQHGPAEYADITTIEPYHAALTTFLTSLPT